MMNSYDYLKTMGPEDYNKALGRRKTQEERDDEADYRYEQKRESEMEKECEGA